jgi:hypothetical protein
LRLSQIDRQERAARPRDNKSREFDDGEREQFPRNPEVEEDGFERMRIGLEELPLLFAWGAFAKVRVAFGGRLLAEVGHCAMGSNLGDVAAELLGVFVVWV